MRRVVLISVVLLAACPGRKRESARTTDATAQTSPRATAPPPRIQRVEPATPPVDARPPGAVDAQNEAWFQRNEKQQAAWRKFSAEIGAVLPNEETTRKVLDLYEGYCGGLRALIEPLREMSSLPPNDPRVDEIMKLYLRNSERLYDDLSTEVPSFAGLVRDARDKVRNALLFSCLSDLPHASEVIIFHEE